MFCKGWMWWLSRSCGQYGEIQKKRNPNFQARNQMESCLLEELNYWTLWKFSAPQPPVALEVNQNPKAASTSFLVYCQPPDDDVFCCVVSIKGLSDTNNKTRKINTHELFTVVSGLLPLEPYLVWVQSQKKGVLSKALAIRRPVYTADPGKYTMHRIRMYRTTCFVPSEYIIYFTKDTYPTYRPICLSSQAPYVRLSLEDTSVTIGSDGIGEVRSSISDCWSLTCHTEDF